MGRTDEPKDREAGDGTASPLSRKEQGAAGEQRKPAGKKPARKKPAGKKPPVKGAGAGAGAKAPRKPFGKPGGKGAGVRAQADKPGGFGGKPRFGGKPTGVGARLAGKRFGRPGDKPADAVMGDFAERPLRGNMGKRGGMPGVNPVGERGLKHLGRPKPFGTPGARFAVQPDGKPLGRPGAKPLGAPGAKPLGRPGAKALGAPGGKPLGRPGAKALGTPGGKPVGAPGATPVGAPGGKPLGRPGAKPLGRPAAQPGIKPLGRPGAKAPIRAAAKRQPDRPAEALSAPKLDSLAAAKLAWQPTLTWCVKQLRVTHSMDPAVQTAVEQFHSWVKAVVSATDAAQFREAQSKAVSSVSAHQFLRWAPLPSPLPSL
ncbi:MAG: hypothetical protein JWN15_3231 [Firmicutes bacterium]|nr:hypothetical protein [Bacillota bacterium]